MIVNVAPLLKQPIGASVDLSLEEAPIDPRGENAELLESGALDIAADLRAVHTNPGAYFEGEANARIEQECSRCLRRIATPVTASFAEQYYATIEVTTGLGMAAAPTDSKTIGSDFRVDLTPLLREELILATPQAPLCRPDCRGLCVTCGDDLNERPHVHEDHIDARWAKLESLQDFHAERQ